MQEGWRTGTSAIQTTGAELREDPLSVPHGRNPLPAGSPNADRMPVPATMAVMSARMIVVGIRNSHSTFLPVHSTTNRVAAKRDRLPRKRTRQFNSRRFPTCFRNMALAGSRAGGRSRRCGAQEATRPWAQVLPETLLHGCTAKIPETGNPRGSLPCDRFVASGSAQSPSEEIRICFQIDTSSMSTYSLRRPHGPNSAWHAPMT